MADASGFSQLQKGGKRVRFCPPGRWEEKGMGFALSLSPGIGKWTGVSTPLISRLAQHFGEPGEVALVEAHFLFQHEIAFDEI